MYQYHYHKLTNWEICIVDTKLIEVWLLAYSTGNFFYLCVLYA